MTLHLCGNISGLHEIINWILSADRPRTPWWRSIYHQGVVTVRKQRLRRREGGCLPPSVPHTMQSVTLKSCSEASVQACQCSTSRLGVSVAGAGWCHAIHLTFCVAMKIQCWFLHFRLLLAKIFTPLSFSLICSSIGSGKLLLSLEKIAIMYSLFHTKELLAAFSLKGSSH